MNLFKRKKPISDPAVENHFPSITLCTVKINSADDFKAFCQYGYINRMVINYALSDPEDWKRAEPIVDCFAVIKYAPNAGMGRHVRVDFIKWSPYSSKGLGEKFEAAHKNYETV